ncbi:glycosyltransferase family 39 protein [Streptomyces sp. NPDC059909]|uniref:glycosyltransferase family 39 protein n=1 Tax=Streptomyces sp. NPDC059909 TaxID=3346998 RepID=UPI0036586AD7
MALLPDTATDAASAPPERQAPPASQTPPSTERFRGALRAVWLWPAVATLACALYGIGTPLLWSDELNSWDVSSRDIGQLLDTVRQVDAVLGGYYLFLHGWMAVFGDSAVMLRLPSALAMAGAAACTALCGKRLFGRRRAGVAAGLLFALIPAVSRYAHEVRPYALVVCAVSLATLLLLRALDRPGSRWRWAAYGLCVAVVGLLNLLALTALVGHAAVVVLRTKAERRRLWGFGLAAAAGVAAVAPVVLLGRAQSRQIAWIPEPDALSLVSVWPELFGSSLLVGAVLALAASAWGRSRGPVLVCVALGLLPALVLWAVSHGDVSYFFNRYLLITVPAWAMLAGAGIAARSRAVAASVLVVLTLLTLPEHRDLRMPFTHTGGLDYAGAARIIERFRAPGDAIVLDRERPWGDVLDVALRFYLPDHVRMRDVFLAESAAERNHLRANECPDPAACVGSEPRVWLVVAGDQPNPLMGLPLAQRQALRAKYMPTRAEHVQGLTVALLERMPDALSRTGGPPPSLHHPGGN